MENSSKALLMAAEILFGVILLTMFVAGFRYMSNFSGTVNDRIDQKNVLEYNSKFEKFDNRNDLIPQDVVTIVNLVNEHNKSVDENGGYKITITRKC